MSLALIRSSPAVDLNPEQQLAVEHGIGDPKGSGPLLVIAGAGSGKTAMLAHRVAALILAGADPKRIMLATFSRRAAAELGRRVERLLARRLAPEAAAAATPAYAGTFHAIGARLLREYATRLGLDPQFTIHDREDSADLMNWARHELGVGDAEAALPDESDVPHDLFARRQRARRSQGDARQMVSVGRGARGRAARAIRVLRRDEAAPERARLRRPPALFRPDAGRAGDRGGDRRALRSSAGRRIPGHQCAAGRDRAGA